MPQKSMSSSGGDTISATILRTCDHNAEVAHKRGPVTPKPPVTTASRCNTLRTLSPDRCRTATYSRQDRQYHRIRDWPSDVGRSDHRPDCRCGANDGGAQHDWRREGRHVPAG